MTDFAPPTFNEADDQVIRHQIPHVPPNRPVRVLLKLASDEPHGTLNFQPADVGAGENVSGRPSGDGDLGEAEDPRGEVVANVTLDSAGPGGGADQPQGAADVRG